MNLEKIKKIVQDGENDQIEFKRSTAVLQATFETICAFLNNKGGVVLIGVTNDGKLIGQDIADHTKQEIASHIGKIEPSAQSLIEIKYVPIESEKKIIFITVKVGKHCPYTYDGRAFQRTQSATMRMSQHRYEQLIVEREQFNHAWEEVILDDYSLKDLDHEEIYKTVSDGIFEHRIPSSAQRDSVRKILKRLNLTVGDKLKRAAVVLYAKQDSLRLVQCMIKLARFKGLNKLGEFIDNQQIQGNAFHLLSEADAFFRRHLPIASFFKPDQFKRVDTPALPVMAVREALINALCHRDYADYRTDISVAIFDDRVEIWNNGDLPHQITLKKLKHAHESVLRNKLIANAFYVRGMIEKWGTGTNKMMDLCKADGVPEPEFTERTGGLVVTFRFKKPIGVLEDDAKKINNIELTARQKEILTIIKKQGDTGIRCVMPELKVPPTQRTVQKELVKLKNLGLVNCKGKGRATSWYVV